MGLFSKSSGYETAAIELEESQRRRERPASSPSATQKPVSQPKAPPMAPPTLKPEANLPEPGKAPAYGIEDVIQLMRDLPDNKKEMVILIVQKTLVSAKIDIKNILEKAARKIETLQSKNDKMRSEIRELEEMIIQKKSDVDRLRRDIEETQQVRQSFEQVYLRGTRTAPPGHFEEDPGTEATGLDLDQVSAG